MRPLPEFWRPSPIDHGVQLTAMLRDLDHDLGRCRETVGHQSDIKPLRIDQPAGGGRQRNPQEIHRQHHGCIGVQHRARHAVVRECAANRDHDDPAERIRRRPYPDVERGKKSGCGLDHQHPENDGQRILGAGQGLHHGDGNAETDGCAKRDQLTGIDFAGRRTNDHEDADHTEHDCRNLPDRHALAKKTRGQDRGPDRHGELDRHHLGDRNQREREEPAELCGIVNEIAPDMLQRPRRLHRREAAVGADQRIQNEEAEDRAHLHDLKHVQLVRRFAARDRHDQHQGQPA